MPPVTHFELYILKPNGWSLEQRYSSSERELAVREAKELENQTRYPTKVVREVYDPTGHTASEDIVYLSPRLKDGRPGAWVGASGRRAAGAGAFDDPSAADEKAPTATGLRTADLLGRVLLVLSASLILAGLSTAIVPSLLSFLYGLGLPVKSGNLGQVLIGLFLAVFLISTAVIGRRLIPLAGLLRDGWSKEGEAGMGWGSKGGAGKGAATGARAPEPPVDPVALMDEAPQLDAAEAERARKRQEQAAREEAERQQKADEERRRQEAAAQAAAPPEPAPAPAVVELSPEQEQGRRLAMAFLAGVVAKLKSSALRIDTFGRFGINLYLNGAVGLVGERLGLTGPALHPLYREVLELMGNRPGLIDLFLDKMDEYALEPRYLRMARHGRDAMAQMLGQDGDPFIDLPGIMSEWSSPQTKAASSSTVAIVFTDMVGSTDLNSRLGDTVSRGVNRIHNTLVRSALVRFDGREVKNTGDGIMAIFPIVSQAVEAMATVQRAVADHNERNPDAAFHIRIGINAGEPVVEEGDYFGLAVTLAARICQEAAPDQILCSGVVRDLSQGKTLFFIKRGDVALKGIADPQRLYEVAWQSSLQDPAAPRE